MEEEGINIIWRIAGVELGLCHGDRGHLAHHVDLRSQHFGTKGICVMTTCTDPGDTGSFRGAPGLFWFDKSRQSERPVLWSTSRAVEIVTETSRLLSEAFDEIKDDIDEPNFRVCIEEAAGRLTPLRYFCNLLEVELFTQLLGSVVTGQKITTQMHHEYLTEGRRFPSFSLFDLVERQTVHFHAED